MRRPQEPTSPPKNATHATVPFNRPFIGGNELRYIQDALDHKSISAGGQYTQRCESFLQERFGIPRVLTTPSCTAALELAALLCDLKPGDEVILPSYTFVSTANAFVLRGATPVFVDIRPDTLNIDESLIESAITDRTKVICPVHYAGVACEMDRIMQIAKEHGLLVIEDAAQAVNASYKGRPLGSIGDFGTYSFHDTKNYVCGEGGALCINNERFIERAEVLREKGTNRQAFRQGRVDKYSWVDVGSSYLLSEINCAFLAAQLEHLNTILAMRKHIFTTYMREFESLASDGVLRLPSVPDDCQTNYHLFYVLLRDSETRNGLIDYLHNHSIQACFHYVPLHLSAMGRQLASCARLPITERCADRLVRLPLYPDLNGNELHRVIDAVVRFLS